MSDNISPAADYIFKGLMAPSTYKLFRRARSVVASCRTHAQLFYAIQYNILARKSSGFDWCIDSYIDAKLESIKASELED